MRDDDVDPRAVRLIDFLTYCMIIQSPIHAFSPLLFAIHFTTQPSSLRHHPAKTRVCALATSALRMWPILKSPSPLSRSIQIRFIASSAILSSHRDRPDWRGMMASCSTFAGSSLAFHAPAARTRRTRRPTARRFPQVSVALGVTPLGVDATFNGTGKTVLITGAASGIGLEAAKQMCAAGCRVLVAARSAEKARLACDEVTRYAGTGGGGAEPVVLDLGNLGKVRHFASDFVKRGGKLDAVVCNAGVAPDRAGNSVTEKGPPRRTQDGFEETIGVNHFGHFALVTDLLPSLKKGARVVVTSSCVHDPTSADGRNGLTPTLGDLSGLEQGPEFAMCDGSTFDGNKAYKDSKLCNVLFARELSRRLARDGTGITANAFSPGFCPSSGLFRLQSPPVRALLKFAFDHPPLATTMENAGRFTTQMVLGVNTGTMTGAYLCGPPSFVKSGEDDFPLGGGFLRGFFQPEFGVKLPSDEALNDELGAKLWEISEKLVAQVTAREVHSSRSVSNVITFAPPSAKEKENGRKKVGEKEAAMN